MAKAAVIVAPGFEEGEMLTIVDIIRRGNIQCDMFGFSKNVVGTHNIEVQCDKVLSDELCDYDMVVLPGGLPGATNLRDNDELISLMQKMNDAGKYVCAMCAAPIALERAGLLKGKNYTAYNGYDEKIKDGNFVNKIVVEDGNIITSRGPATVYAFSYYLLEKLGGDAKAVKERMIYNHAFEEVELWQE